MWPVEFLVWSVGFLMLSFRFPGVDLWVSCWDVSQA